MKPFLCALALLSVFACNSESKRELDSASLAVDTCTHALCITGAALVADCDVCVAHICAADSFCCTTAWDYQCVNEAETICGAQCPSCGNGVCGANEACDTCPEDCGACPSCGDGTCNGDENCTTCSQDCGACPVCGDGACTGDEDCANCTGDCGACAACTHSLCAKGGKLDKNCDPCVATVCAADNFCCEAGWDAQCVNEAATLCQGVCPNCGDGICSNDETCTTCAADCGACPSCGDGTCNGDETCTSCTDDCGPCPACGDGTCNGNEDCKSCHSDCGDCAACEHAYCATGPALDKNCDSCVTAVCAEDPFCCTSGWDGQCVTTVATACGMLCEATCGDGFCAQGEDCNACSIDCGPCSSASLEREQQAGSHSIAGR